MDNKKQKISYLLAIMAYIGLASVFTLVTYLDQKNIQNQWINKALHEGVDSMLAVLPTELQMLAMDGGSFSQAREEQIAETLGNLAESHGLAYLYTLIKDDDDVLRFVISSPSPEEIAGTVPYERVYLTEYAELSEQLRPLFESDTEQYLDYSDRWGDFRSLFRPTTTPDDRIYLVGADIDIAEVKQALFSSIIKTIFMLTLLFIVTMPLLIVVGQARQRELQQQISTMLIDPMTRLRNRIALSQDLKGMANPQLMILDLLRFTYINNAYGPARADLVISRFAKHLSRFSHPALKPHQTYRLHGDEFAVLVDQKEMPEDVDDVFRDFLAYLSGFEYKLPEGEIIRLKVAAGVVLNRRTDFITSAKIALLTAREQGRALVVFDEKLPRAERFQENLQQLELLQRAIDEKRLVPWFQPIFDAESLSPIAYEALARIVDENGNIISMPDDFLPVAHRYRLYYKVTREMVRQTIDWLGNNNCNASINLSIRDIEHRGTRKYILRKIYRSGMGPRLSFELVESEAITDLDLTRSFFKQLSKLGCRLGIDDLGKEYSNFDRLMALPLDFLKLDGTVVQHIAADEEGFSVVQNIVKLAHKKKLKVTAEVISDELYLGTARRLGCDHVQGYHVGIPSPEQVT